MSMNQVDSPLRGFESPWSIIEKIKKANVVNSRQLLQRYGPELPITRGSIISKKYLSLWTFDGFDHQKLTQAIGFSLSDHTESIKRKLTQMFPTYIKSESLFRDTLHFCKDCMKLNYHSLLHQFKFIETCPFHLCALDSECPCCKKSIPYLLPRHQYESGFICNCGESLSNQDIQQHLVDSLTLKDPNVIAWLSLTEENIERLQKTVIFRPFLDSNLNLMEEMINLVQVNTEGVYYSSIFDLNSDVPNKDTVEMNYKEIYWSLVRTLEAFEKHLFSTSLKKHQHCIKRFVGMYKKREEGFPPICPYAYAYVFWKESMYRINPFVDEGKRFSHKNIKPFDLPFYCFEEDFKEILMVFNRSDYRMMTWLLNHLLWEVANTHFNKWVTIANQYAKLQIRPQIDTSYQETDTLILFKLNKDKIIKHTNNETIIITTSCPYESKPTFDPEEISYLPMRLAMSKGMSEEKKTAEKYLQRLRILTTIR